MIPILHLQQCSAANYGDVAKMVNAYVLETYAERLVGSSSTIPTVIVAQLAEH